MFHNVYRGKRVFVTGHTGFKGSWLCAWLVSLGAEVTGYSRDIPTNPSHFEAMHLAGHMHDVRGDIRDREHLCRAMAEAKPDIVFHLAAQALFAQIFAYGQGADFGQILPDRRQGATGGQAAPGVVDDQEITDMAVQKDQRTGQQQALARIFHQQGMDILHIVHGRTAYRVGVAHYFCSPRESKISVSSFFETMPDPIRARRPFLP